MVLNIVAWSFACILAYFHNGRVNTHTEKHTRCKTHIHQNTHTEAHTHTKTHAQKHTHTEAHTHTEVHTHTYTHKYKIHLRRTHTNKLTSRSTCPQLACNHVVWCGLHSLNSLTINISSKRMHAHPLTHTHNHTHTYTHTNTQTHTNIHSRVRIAVACIKVASQAVGAMPSILAFPLLPFIFEVRYVCRWAYPCVCVSVSICFGCVYVCVHVCACVCVFLCEHVCVCVHISLCACVCIRVIARAQDNRSVHLQILRDGCEHEAL